MNYKSILFFLGIYSLTVSFFSVLNVLYSFYFNFTIDLNSYLFCFLISSIIGILFCLNYLSGIVFCVIWLLIFFVFKYSSLSSIVSSFCIPIFQYFFISDPFYYFYFIMFIMIFYTHRENIKRLINKTESKTKIY